jgi:hypothetical protein
MCSTRAACFAATCSKDLHQLRPFNFPIAFHQRANRSYVYRLMACPRKLTLTNSRLRASVEGPLVDAFSHGPLQHQLDLHLYVLRTMFLGVIGIIGLKVNRVPFPILGLKAPNWRRTAEARRLRRLKASHHRSYFADDENPLPRRLKQQVGPELSFDTERWRKPASSPRKTPEDFH